MMTYEHIRMRMEYLEGRLRRLPKGMIMTRKKNGKDYTVVYISDYPDHPKYKYKRFSTTRSPGSKLAKMVAEHNNILSELTELKVFIKSAKTPRKISKTKRRSEPVKMDRSFFESLKLCADSNPYDKPANAVEYKGILMRTKGEVMIAQRLDQLHYEYIYEPRIWAGHNIYPDFAVYIPEIDRVIFIEYMGALSNPSYLPSAGEKFKAFAGIGYIVGRDVIFICETDNSATDLELLEAQLSAVVMANTELSPKI